MMTNKVLCMTRMLLNEPLCYICFAVLCILIPRMALSQEPMVALPELEDKVSTSLQLQAAGAQVDSSRHFVHEEESKEGVQLYGKVNTGRHKEVVTDTFSRTYSSITPQVGISYPLLGERAQHLEASQDARTALAFSAIDMDVERLQLLWELRKNYILYWQFQQQQQLTEKHVMKLSSLEEAAKALVNRGLWTKSDYLKFLSDLASARNNQTQYATMEHDALNGMRIVIGANLTSFTAVKPGFPALCNVSPYVYQSAEAHSGDLKKLTAQLENIKVHQDLTTGRAINLDVYLAAQYDDQYTISRSGYGVGVGANFTMPLSFMEADQANTDKLHAASMQNNALTNQTRSELQLKVRNAVEDYQQAALKLQATDAAEHAASEALRESTLRFENVPQPLFGELMDKIILEYQTSIADVEATSNAALRANDLLLLSPDPCPGKL